MKILIIKLSALGDIIQALKAVRKFHEQYPSIKISWLIEKKYASILSGIPFINEIITVDTYALRKNPIEIIKEYLRFKKMTFDQVIDLQGNFKSFLFLQVIKSKEKIGFDWRGIPEKIALLPLTLKIPVANHLPMTKQYEKVLFQKELAHANSPEKKETLTTAYFLLIGSRWENKKLPLEYWIKIANFLFKKAALPIYVPYFGQKEEIEVKLLKDACPFIIPVFETDFNRLKQQFSDRVKVIGVDSFLLHLASYQSAKTFGIFGPSSAKIYQPERGDSWQSRCPENLEFIKRCPRLRSCEHGNCLKRLPIEALLSKLKDF